MKALFLIICSFIIVSFGALASTRVMRNESPNTIYFVYSHQIGNQYQIRWFSMDNPKEESFIDTPPFYEYAISSTGNDVAIVGIGQNPQIHIANLHEQTLISLPLYEPRLEMLWDEHYLRSGTLLWSPDGTQLAFTGMTSPDSSKADVYLFDLQTLTPINLTRSTSVVRSMIPNAWSPDSQWLTINGAWSISEDNIPVWETMAFSTTTNQIITIAPRHQTCRLAWSPNGQYLASDTACFAGIANSTSLMIFPFDTEAITEDGLRQIDINQPLYLEWEASQGWEYRYTEPIWVDNTTVVASRALFPMQVNEYISEEMIRQDQSLGLIRFNIETYSETLIREERLPSERADRHHEWFLLGNNTSFGIGKMTLYHPITEQLIEVPSTIQSCPASDAIELSSDGRYLAVIDACSLSSRFEPALRIYDTSSFEEILTFNDQFSAEQRRPLGFFTR